MAGMDRREGRASLWHLAVPVSLWVNTAHAASPSPAQRDLWLWGLGLLLVVLIPVWLLAIRFPWHEHDGRATPGAGTGRIGERVAEAVVWLVPAVLVVCIGAMVWLYVHRPDTDRPLARAGVAQMVSAGHADATAAPQ
ncbi:hypothetical protein G3580_01450 [Nitrogeniibacter mangrovi]|uniref:Uncharacterized protein n=1 Tax=Nitrogeniibacter mangrovi TaxID=2016596 RepID=A0A6C1AYJ4_9RHOO|nr:hypothetical protein [Nitrogeniibacter mangrovi]QID16407.1 hypothetical protein G3580_01450 [Nitrogeniibacter mangrovi]